MARAKLARGTIHLAAAALLTTVAVAMVVLGKYAGAVFLASGALIALVHWKASKSDLLD